MITVRNEFDSLLETSERHTPNEEYENCVTAQKQQLYAYQPNQEPNVEFHANQ